MASNAPDQTVDTNNAWRLDSPAPPAGNAPRAPTIRTNSSSCRPTATCRNRTTSGCSGCRKTCTTACPASAFSRTAQKFQKTEGFRPIRIRDVPFEGEDRLRNQSGKTPEERLKDLAADGVDCEVLFPNKGLAMWATPDAKFSQAHVPRVQRMGVGSIRPVQRPPRADGVHRNRRHRRRDRRSAAHRQARLQRPVAAVQTGVGRAEPRRSELQPAGLRSAVGRDSGRRHARSRSTFRPAAIRAPRAATAAPSSTTRCIRSRRRWSRS